MAGVGAGDGGANTAIADTRTTIADTRTTIADTRTTTRTRKKKDAHTGKDRGLDEVATGQIWKAWIRRHKAMKE